MPPPRPLVRYGRYGAAAFEFTGTIAGGATIGWLVDRTFHTEPWGAVGLTLAAVVGGFVRLIQILRRFDRSDREP